MKPHQPQSFVLKNNASLPHLESMRSGNCVKMSKHSGMSRWASAQGCEDEQVFRDVKMSKRSGFEDEQVFSYCTHEDRAHTSGPQMLDTGWDIRLDPTERA